MTKLNFRIIDPLEHRESMLHLLIQLNPKMDSNTIENNLVAMAKMSNYTCFGLFDEADMIGVASGWTTVRIYCGKQIELDNVIIDPKMQAKGLGAILINHIKQWSIENHFQSIGLNTYVENHPSHKFYFNHGFSVIGYHFETHLEA